MLQLSFEGESSVPFLRMSLEGHETHILISRSATIYYLLKNETPRITENGFRYEVIRRRT